MRRPPSLALGDGVFPRVCECVLITEYSRIPNRDHARTRPVLGSAISGSIDGDVVSLHGLTTPVEDSCGLELISEEPLARRWRVIEPPPGSFGLAAPDVRLEGDLELGDGRLEVVEEGHDHGGAEGLVLSGGQRLELALEGGETLEALSDHRCVVMVA